MKIFIVVPTRSGGGAEFVASQWGRALVLRNHEVTMVYTHGNSGESEDIGQTIVLEPGSAIFHLVQFRNLLAVHRPDVVLSLLPYCNLLAIISALSIPLWRRPRTIISGRNVESPYPAVHSRRYRLVRLLGRWTYPRADGFLAISHPVAAEAGILFRIPANRIGVVPNPALAKIRRRAILVQGDNTLGRQDLHIVLPGRLAPQKRPLLTIEAAGRLLTRGYLPLVHIFGVGPLEGTVRDRAKRLGVEVQFHGWVESWFEKCPSGSVVVLTSKAEGFGNVLIEAAASGFPCVASSRCLGVADAIIPNITGILTVGDSIEEYVEAILAARKLPVENIDAWLARFSLENSVDLLEQFLLPHPPTSNSPLSSDSKEARVAGGMR